MPNRLSDEEIKAAAVHRASTPTATGAVKEYELICKHQFSSAGRCGRVSSYRCTRSQCARVADPAKRLKAYDGKNVNCPVRLTVYNLQGEFFILNTPGHPIEHSHESETRFHRYKDSEVTVRRRIRRLAREKAKLVAQGKILPDTPGDDTSLTLDPSSLELQSPSLAIDPACSTTNDENVLSSPTPPAIQTAPSKPQRFAHFIRLRPEHVSEYLRIHNPIPTSIANCMRKCHIHDYSIFHDRASGLLFASFKYSGVDFSADMEVMRSDPDTREWWKVTDAMQESLNMQSSGSEDAVHGWWRQLDEVFRQE